MILLWWKNSREYASRGPRPLVRRRVVAPCTGFVPRDWIVRWVKVKYREVTSVSAGRKNCTKVIEVADHSI